MAKSRGLNNKAKNGAVAVLTALDKCMSKAKTYGETKAFETLKKNANAIVREAQLTRGIAVFAQALRDKNLSTTEQKRPSSLRSTHLQAKVCAGATSPQVCGKQHRQQLHALTTSYEGSGFCDVGCQACCRPIFLVLEAV